MIVNRTARRTNNKRVSKDSGKVVKAFTAGQGHVLLTEATELLKLDDAQKAALSNFLFSSSGACHALNIILDRIIKSDALAEIIEAKGNGLRVKNPMKFRDAFQKSMVGASDSSEDNPLMEELKLPSTYRCNREQGTLLIEACSGLFATCPKEVLESTKEPKPKKKDFKNQNDFFRALGVWRENQAWAAGFPKSVCGEMTETSLVLLRIMAAADGWIEFKAKWTSIEGGRPLPASVLALEDILNPQPVEESEELPAAAK